MVSQEGFDRILCTDLYPYQAKAHISSTKSQIIPKLQAPILRILDLQFGSYLLFVF
jgi:hypothetical protein